MKNNNFTCFFQQLQHFTTRKSGLGKISPRDKQFHRKYDPGGNLSNEGSLSKAGSNLEDKERDWKNKKQRKDTEKEKFNDNRKKKAKKREGKETRIPTIKHPR